jgi:hypothetical protein
MGLSSIMSHFNFSFLMVPIRNIYWTDWIAAVYFSSSTEFHRRGQCGIELSQFVTFVALFREHIVRSRCDR